MSKPKSNVNKLIDEIMTDVISYTNPSKEDLEKQIEEDKINYLVWQCGVAIKELQSAVDELSKDKDQEAS
tara:strand:+ start:615 stop:824 length:210 start_codon:yes stop_codon:yes gene_type:complete